jgi:hypothetical protein
MNGQLRVGRPALMLADDVTDAIDDGLPEIGLESALIAHFDGVDVPQDAEHRVLYQVLRLHQAAREVGQASSRPAAERRKASRHEVVEGVRVTLAVSFEELDRRLGVERASSPLRGHRAMLGNHGNGTSLSGRNTRIIADRLLDVNRIDEGAT